MKVLQAIIRIQAAIRGKLVRMKFARFRRIIGGKSKEFGGIFDEGITENAFLFNPRVIEVYEREGRFDKPSKAILGDSMELIDKEPYRMTNGVIYHGQWTIDLKARTGFGRQVWLDGSLYEG